MPYLHEVAVASLSSCSLLSSPDYTKTDMTRVEPCKYRPVLKLELPHADNILMDFGKSLFAFMYHEVGPVFELLINHFQSSCIVLG